MSPELLAHRVPIDSESRGKFGSSLGSEAVGLTRSIRSSSAVANRRAELLNFAIFDAIAAFEVQG